MSREILKLLILIEKKRIIDGLVGVWKLDEGSGNIVYDSSGNNNHRTIYGASWTYEKIGRGLFFDGVDDYVRVENSPSINVESVTLCAWTYPTDFGAESCIHPYFILPSVLFEFNEKNSNH